MGDPRKKKKKYQSPAHPWEGDRIEEENKLVKDFGFKNKKEIWKMKTKLMNFINQTRKLIADTTEQGEKEKKQLLNKLSSLGLLNKTSKMEDILGLTHKDLMERRLQTLVFRKGLAKSINQARQFIVHGHVMVNNKKITSPSYLVLVSEEGSISVSPSLNLEEPVKTQKEVKEEPKKEEKKN